MKLKSTLTIILAVSLVLIAGLFFLKNNQPQIIRADGSESLYTTKDTAFEAGFAGKDNPTRVVFKKDGSTLSFNLPYENIEWKKEGEKLIADVGEGKEYSYSLLKNKDNEALGLKEEIILKEPTDQNTFQFTLDLEGLIPKKGQDGLWHFYGSAGSPQAGKELFFIPKPYMEDANGVRSEKVEITIDTCHFDQANESERVEKSLSEPKRDSSTSPRHQVGTNARNDKEGDLCLSLKADKDWLLSPERKYPIKIDPSLQLTILTVHSHPQQGEEWQVDFETIGKADLRIIPDDQATIEDIDFVNLTCSSHSEGGTTEESPVEVEILENDIIYVPNFQCEGTATVTHYVNRAAPHRLKFNFGGEIDYAYNAPGSTTYTFSGVTQDTNDYYAYEDYGATVFTDQDDTGESEATNTDYDNIESDNATRWDSSNSTVDGHFDAQLYKFFIDETESAVTQLDFKWNGYGETESGYNTIFYAWDYDGGSWTELSQVDFNSTTDQDLTFNESTDPGKFVDGDGEVTLMVKSAKYIGSEDGYCSDGVDNDGDGCTDGNDVDCGATEANCSDGIDNDCDGCTDSNDSDCGATEANCSDGIDNDCDGATDSCDPDCGAISDESGCCSDGFDNDGDGWTDLEDLDCSLDCVCDGTSYQEINREGDTVYVDCNTDKCWTPTQGEYPWSANLSDASSCVGQGSDFEACHHCDTLTHGGFDDWYLPSKSTLRNLCNSGSCSDTCFGGDGFSANYRSSTEYDSTHAWNVGFYGCSTFTANKDFAYYVRCVR